MRHCAYCGLAQRQETVRVMRPSTPTEIEKARKLTEQADALWRESKDSYGVIEDKERKLKDRAFRLAGVYSCRFPGWHYEGCEPDGKTPLRETTQRTGKTVRFQYGDGLFCRLKCAEAFATAAHRAGYRIKREEG